MFTGLIEEIGCIKSVIKKGNTIEAEISALIVLENTKIGDSISISGVCQTVTSISKSSFSVEISSTTLEKTTLKQLQEMKYVNLERAMVLGDRLGGHLVQGHVNNRAVIRSISNNESMYILELLLSKDEMRYVINEGSITVDGISLTVSEKSDDENIIIIRIIPHTYLHTVLKYKKAGDSVNIETDMIGRFIESLMKNNDKEQISMEKIRNWGF